jgi:CBS domain-containing protein
VATRSSGEPKVKVEQLMVRDVEVCTEADTLNRAAELMWEHDCGCIPVISLDGDGTIVGILTDRDIAMAAYTQGKQLWAIPAVSAMARKIIACHANDSIGQAAALMRDNEVRRLPVVDENEHLVGILSVNDIVREAHREKGSGNHAEVTEEDVLGTLASICLPRTSHVTASQYS